MPARNRRTPRKRPRQARSRATFDAILEAGARVLVREGYDRASTNRIAEVAGVGIGSLYEFFPNKDAIFTELRRRLNEDMLAFVSRAMEEAIELPVREAVARTVELLVRAHAVNPRLHIALKDQVPDEALADQSRAVRHRLGELGMAFVRRHRDELRPRDLEFAVFVAIQATESLTLEAARFHKQAVRDGTAAREITDLVTRYLVD